jgi:hypothetical protein
MRFVSGWIRAAGVACLGLCWVGSASAAVIVNVSQSGNDVVISFSGSLANLGTPVSAGSLNSPSKSTVFISSGQSPSLGEYQSDLFRAIQPGIIGFRLFEKVSGSATSWGPGGTQTSTETFTDNLQTSGINMFIAGSEWLAIPQSYTYGSTFTGSATFYNKTLATMGVTNLGSFVYTYGSGANTDTVTFNIGSGGGGGEVPEPTSMAIFGLGALGMAYRARRKAKA